jgi:EAL domain-containing protein (putative c-di-GMP-specific phosphodiesterase class I)
MPILSKAGKLADLDALVFERIMAVHYGNHRAASTKLSLNVSGNSLEDLTYLREVAQKGQDVLKHLIFEVRSNEVIRDPNALQLLKALQRQGAQIAIDYFGGGSGMVQATHALGLEYIKADAIRMADKPKKKDLLEMCMMAVELKVPVIMEKIEDKRSEDFARQAGVQFLQGYSLGKPTTTLNILSLPAKLKS